MTGWQLFISGWEWHPSVIAGCVLLLAGYCTALRFRLDRHALFFCASVITIFLALVSPLDPLSDDYLFSAHMVQHILLNMVAPPLLVLGLPAVLMRRFLRVPLMTASEHLLGQPVFALCVGSLTLWAWHLPSWYNATLENDGIHIFEHLTLLVTGTMMWWPVFTRLDERRLSPVMSTVYLLLASVPNGLLGIFFTFAHTPYYSGYAHPNDELGALSLIRDTWKLDQISDQQLGGAIMWVVGSAIYLWAILVVVVRWFRKEEDFTTN